MWSFQVLVRLRQSLKAVARMDLSSGKLKMGESSKISTNRSNIPWRKSLPAIVALYRCLFYRDLAPYS